MPATASLPEPFNTRTQERADLLAAWQSYFRSNKASLVEAARCTADLPGADLARRLCDDINAAGRWHTPFMRRAELLRGLLSLDHLDDPETVYPIPVGALDPTAPWVNTCCRHVEQLDALIARSAAITCQATPLPQAPLRRPMRTT